MSGPRAGRLAIVAGAGRLPALLAAAEPAALCVTFGGVSRDVGPPARRHRFEALGAMFDDLRAEGVRRVVLAGAMSRPRLDPAACDALTAQLAPRITRAMQAGDDGLLRFVIGLVEAQGFAVVGAQDVAPDLLAAPGPVAGPPLGSAALADAARARAILAALGPLDVGQGAVVAGGLCLGIETVQGTDALLRHVAATPPGLRRGRGVLVKAPKPGQDARVDLPAIGPETVRQAAAAGLEGIVIEAGGVLVLDRAALVQAADQAGLSVIAGDAPA